MFPLNIFRRLARLERIVQVQNTHIQALQGADAQIKAAIGAMNTRVTNALNNLKSGISDDDDAAIDGVVTDLEGLKTSLDAIAPADPAPADPAPADPLGGDTGGGDSSTTAQPASV